MQLFNTIPTPYTISADHIHPLIRLTPLVIYYLLFLNTLSAITISTCISHNIILSNLVKSSTNNT